MNNFDTQPLLNEINNLVKNSVQEIVKDFMKRHALLEETHDKLVNLPSVKQYYNTSCQNNTSSVVKINPIKIEPESEIHETIKEDISEKISSLDDKINNMWKIYGDHFVKMSNQLDELKNEINSLRIQQNSSTPTCIKVEKENITLEIVDDAVNECKNEEHTDQLKELEVEEVEEEEEEEEEEEVEEEEEEEVEEEEEEEEVEEEEVEEEEVEEEEEVASVETETKEIDADEEEEEDEELIEIEIDDITYCTNNEDNGMIYELDKHGNVGKKVGYLKEGDAYFD
jgi:chemotaxis protein histidine kinase CheA